MRVNRYLSCLCLAVMLTAACTSGPQAGAQPQASTPPPTQAAIGTGDPLPSWNDGPAKKAIVDFVARVTKEGSPDFVPVPERIATFDNDGTLWAEQPLHVPVASSPSTA